MNQESSTKLHGITNVKYKVFAYITNRNHLLAFVHPFAPEAGIQVPAGTVKANERPEEAVLREAFEETGLSNLILDCFLGEDERDMTDFGKDETHHRYFHHLRYEGDPPATWRHEERDSPDICEYLSTWILSVVYQQDISLLTRETFD